MPRTRAQRRATQGPLGGLNDDALRRVLTFLSVADSRRSAGGASKALRAAATSNELTRLRGSESYVLRGSDHGVVHALATALGTQPWRRVSFTYNNGSDQHPIDRDVNNAAVPPSRLQIIVHREPNPVTLGEDIYRIVPHLREDAVFPFQVVDRDEREKLVTVGECCIEAGTFSEFQLPFKMQLSHFRLAHGGCNACRFRDWVFEAFDGEGWHVLYECGASPWIDCFGGFGSSARCFDVDGTAVASSSRFRLRMLDTVDEHAWAHANCPRCMHIRSLDFFGTVLPPWNV